jgi:hypothetical protein
MHPLQVWLPTWGPSIGFPEVARDAQRAFRAWQGEHTIWLLQQLPQPGRWQEDGWWHLAILAELLDRAEVFHIGENGYIHGPEAKTRFPQGRINGLLDAWLNVEKLGGVKYAVAPETLQWRCPVIKGDVIEYVEGTVRLLGGGVAPIVARDSDGNGKVQWPPEGHPGSVSPDAETCAFYASRPDHILEDVQLLLQWPGPLQALLPLMSGLDDLAAQAQMVQIAQESARDPHRALLRAKALAAPYMTEGSTTQEFAWFWPTYLEGGEAGVVYGAEGRFRLIARSLAEARRSPAWRAAMTHPVAIRRVWGAVGLCWALLLEQLEAFQPFQVCERCGRILQARQGKRFCGPEDDEACFRQRRASDQSRSRARRKQSARKR